MYASIILIGLIIILQSMSFYETSNHVRKVKVFIPPSESPLLTTYGKLILPKL